MNRLLRALAPRRPRPLTLRTAALRVYFVASVLLVAILAPIGLLAEPR